MRDWSIDAADSGSLHVLGNGALCAYGQGPDIVQLFGPPYSSPSLLTLRMANPGAQSRSRRENGAAIWRHELTLDGSSAQMLDFVAADLPCLVRRTDCATPMRLTLRFAPGVDVVENTVRFPGAALALLACAPAGMPIYGSYPMVRPQALQVLLHGDARGRRMPDGAWELTVAPGRCDALFCGGPSYPEAICNAEAALQAGCDALLDGARQDWQRFTRERSDLDRLIPAAYPQRQRLLELADSVAVLIRAQQGREGGVLAGHNYHLGYVRDQYGVFRCLLRLGCHEQARAILGFYWDVWQRHGRLHNAQGIGAEVFHVHENDAVEITGYLIVQAFDYLRETGNETFLRTIEPMLRWAFDAQAGQLCAGMLSFNGDETYIAGGILPRDCINDGSAEATLLFLTGGRLLLRWAMEHGLWVQDRCATAQAALRQAEDRFADNFIVGDWLATNNPTLRQLRPEPRFRHGVCQRCGGYVGWTERTEGGRYACPDCLGQTLEPAQHAVHFLKSVSLMPMYIGAQLPPRAMLEAQVRDIAAEYAASGQLPSSPHADSTVGYDYGLLLYSLTMLGHPLSDVLAQRAMAIADDTDAWVEYYRNGEPSGTRCRPWESGINLHALLEHALRWPASSHALRK